MRIWITGVMGRDSLGYLNLRQSGLVEQKQMFLEKHPWTRPFINPCKQNHQGSVHLPGKQTERQSSASGSLYKQQNMESDQPVLPAYCLTRGHFKKSTLPKEMSEKLENQSKTQETARNDQVCLKSSGFWKCKNTEECGPAIPVLGR